jgi:quinoprotein dehydrogenase-associated probable ABC transporter substrate-binding protein
MAAEPLRVLRVSADPNNLPFSNERGEGFENKLAALVARELHAKLEYVWWPQRRGFVRETLNSGRADLVIGVPAGYERLATTRPYYSSTYVFVYRRGTFPIHSFDDPALRIMRIGVQMIGDDFSNTPPAHALAARGHIENIRGYTVFGDYAQESHAAEIIRAVARGEIDVAVAWGPLAGYFATRQAVPLELERVSPEQDGPALPFVFPIAMGVKKGDVALRHELDEIIERCRGEIEAILDHYGVPRVEPPSERKEVSYARVAP